MGFGYDSVGNIVNDAAIELGLGSVADTFGSIDANIIQLRTLLKSAGRKLLLDYDWEHLYKEFSFVTLPNWATNTVYTSAAAAWHSATAYSVGDYRTNGGNLYICTQAGYSDDSNQSGGPTTLDPSIPDGTAIWKYLNAGSANIVVKGKYAYTCVSSGISGPVGPQGSRAGSIETDDLFVNPNFSACNWAWLGNASDYALPSDFSNLIDQAGWNRTNRLPVGGPVSAQEWQYLKGRQQGAVFNVLFRPVDGLLRLYPDTDTPGGYNIVFEYVANSWVGPTGSTSPTMTAPTANTDLIYFDPLLMLRRIKLDWLKAKSFDTSNAQREYDETLNLIISASGAAPVLNLRGRTSWNPLLSPGNIPPTGFGQ